MKILSEGNIPLLRSKVDEKVSLDTYNVDIGNIQDIIEVINQGGGSADPETVDKIYAALEEKGYFLPEPDEQTFENILPTILGEFAPDAPLLVFKAALSAGNAETLYPVGTELEDTWANKSNPLIVAQYLDARNNASYGGAEGALLMRKYVEPTSQTFGSAGYPSSVIQSYLASSYMEQCSEELKDTISSINLPYYAMTIQTLSNQKWFLMSAYEMCGNGSGSNAWEGIMWDCWKQKTGWSSPNNGANNGRVMKDRDGTACRIWLRSWVSASNNMWALTTAGQIESRTPTFSDGVLPACFISKD